MGMGSPKRQTHRWCNQRIMRYEVANWTATFSAVKCRLWKFAQIPGKTYPGTKVALMQTTYEQEAVGMGSLKNANTTFVQSTHKAVRSCKLFRRHHRRIILTMESHANSLQTLPRNSCCTYANYISARSCANGESKNANPSFVQSTLKAVRA